MYNGFKNKTHWNVSLWINNDEGLYSWARELVEKHGAKRASRIMKRELPPKTPDGYSYSAISIYEAIKDILD